MSLTEAELSHANLDHADLTGANLERACMANADLDYVTVDDAFFTSAYLYNVTLTGAGTRNPEYDDPEKGAPPGLSLLGVDFSSSYLGDAKGSNTNLAAASFQQAYISDETRIEGADLSGAQKLPEKDPNSVVREHWDYCFSEARLGDG